MTNEEKAREITNDYPMPPSDITESDVRAMMENSALQMAEYKDHQFKEYLKKKLSDMEYARMRILDDYQQGFYDGRESSVRNIINELFPESEELDNSNMED